MFNIDNHLSQLQYDKTSDGYWSLEIQGTPTIEIQGSEHKPDDKCIETARKALADLDRCISTAKKELNWMLKLNYEYYCHLIRFRDYEYGWKVRTGGFEMFFWQEEPEDDRYVNYVVQFTDECKFRFGIRIFSC